MFPQTLNIQELGQGTSEDTCFSYNIYITLLVLLYLHYLLYILFFFEKIYLSFETDLPVFSSL